jgi:hypothetical protein
MKTASALSFCAALLLVVGMLPAGQALALEALSNQAAGNFESVDSPVEPIKIIGLVEVKCAKGKTNGVFQTKHLGTGEFIFEGCTGPMGVKCETGAVAGEVVIKGSFHLNLARSGPAEAVNPAILFLITPNVTIKCAGFGNIVLRGSLIGLLFDNLGKPLPLGVNLLKGGLRFRTAGAKPQDVEFLLALTVPPNQLDQIIFETSTFGAAFKESGLEGSFEFNKTAAGLQLEE